MTQSPLNILVVDDNPGIRAMLNVALGDEGYAVRTATNGAEALELVEHEAPDLILLDMRMPVMNGWEFARRLRERGGRQPVIIVMTATVDPRQWAEEIGANGHLGKPFELDELFSIIERCTRAGQSLPV